MARAKGTGSVSQYGYIRLGHGGVRKVEHLLMAERALGRELPKGAVVHHANGDKADNRNENLVICPDQKYHFLIHTRMAAMDATGNPDHRKCWLCRKYDDPMNLVTHKRAHYHMECDREYQRSMKLRRNQK